MSCEMTETVRFASGEMILKFFLDQVPSILKKFCYFFIKELQKAKMYVKMLTIKLYYHIY